MPYLNPFFNDAVAATVVMVKGAGVPIIHSLKLVNTTGATAYLQFFGMPASAVTLGTTPANWQIRLGANESVVISLVQPLMVPGSGVDGIGNGLSLAGTTLPGGSVAAAISVSLLYA